jgi:UDP-glucose 4-epimerase
MRILVTGGAGFIGSHLADKLVELGHHVVILDNLSTGSMANLKTEFEFFQGDIRSLSDCLQASKDCDAIYHLAAMSRSGPSLSMVEECLKTNIEGTMNVFRAAEFAQVSTLIYAASSTCYGNSPPPHEVNGRVELLNPYSWSKYSGEQLLLTMARYSRVRVNSLRFFNVYGPREPVKGQYALVIGTFIGRHLNHEVLEIHGDGTQSRDFVHVSDVVECLTSVLKVSKSGLILNVGSGVATTIKEIANLISSRQIHTERRQGDALHTLADIEITTKELGWIPKISIAEGISLALQEASN